MAKRRKPYTVTKVNPVAKKKTTRKKRSTKKKRTAKKRTTRNASKKKPTRKKTSTKRNTVAKKRKKRSKHTSRRKRRTRRNPSRARSYGRRVARKGRYVDIKYAFDGILPRMLGKMAVAWAVRKWGNPETAPNSATTGAAWDFKNYFIAFAASYVGGEVVARFGNEKWGKEFYRGGVDLTVTKLLWSEVFHRSPQMAIALGNPDPMAMLAAQAGEGDIIKDGQGNTWLLQNGEWVSMQGEDDPYTPTPLQGEDDPYTPVPLAAGDGGLVEADYLDGLVEAGEMDGTLVEADALSLGHQMEPDGDRALAQRARYQDTGGRDPYATLYQQ